jgi:hypothetical protein
MMPSITIFLFTFRTRSGKIRVLSFKVGVILMCNGHVDDKYKCKFYSLLNFLYMLVFIRAVVQK